MTTLDIDTLPRCKTCDRPVRPQRAPATPGTVRYGAKDQCSTCYQAQNRKEQRADRERRETARRRHEKALRAAAEKPAEPIIETAPERDSKHPTAWQDDALCAQVDTGIFFPPKGGSTAEAKTVCRACPVRTECLTFALDNGIEHGVWGGTSERERRKLRRKAAA